jgi:hypothetical protein
MGSEDVPPMDAEIVEPLVEDDLFGSEEEKEFEI